MVSCPHDEIDGITCRICGTKMVAKVAKDDTLRYFADFEDAAQYAATLEGSAITLLRDAIWGSMGCHRHEPTACWIATARPSPGSN